MNEENKNTVSTEVPTVVSSVPVADNPTVPVEANPTVTPAEPPKEGMAELPTVDPTAVQGEKQELPTVDPTAVTVPEVQTNNVGVEQVARDPMQNVSKNTNVNQQLYEARTEEEKISAREERLRKANENYKPPSKFKIFMLIVFFGLMIGYILFLPQVNSFVSSFLSKTEKEAKITTGILECDLSTNTENLDYIYERDFSFTDNKLEEADFTITTKGDVTLDEQTLDQMSTHCNSLKDLTSSVDGVSIQCDYTEGKLVQKEKFQYANINDELLSSAYAEAGGTKPEFTYQQDMDSVEKTMNANGYSCMRRGK